MESLLNNLKKHVECSICLETYTDPKTIACLHTFCCECLKKHALTSQRGGKFRCPECQAEIAVPSENRFDQLPTSFHHNSLLSLLAVQQSGDGSEISCGICKKSSADISYCFDCEKLMCCGCKNAHELFRETGFRGHKVILVKEFQVQDYEAVLKRQSFCSQQYHEREETRFFCKECQTCVCQICINTKHKTHEVEPLEEAADGVKSHIMARAQLIKQKRNVCSDAIRKIEETESEMETNFASAKRELSQVADQMVAKIREHERANITALENTRVSRAEKMNPTKREIQSLAKQVDQAIEFADNLVQSSSSSDIIQSKKTVEDRLQDLEKTEIPALRVDSYAKFVPTSAPESLSFGFVSTCKVDATTEGLSEDFQAGVENRFVVRPRIDDEQGNKVNCNFHVDVFIEPSQKVSSLAVSHQEDRSVLVKFIPKVPGCFKISVMVDKEEITNSPFTVQVKQRIIQVDRELDLKEVRRLSGVAVNSKGMIAAADIQQHCILIFSKEGNFVQKLGCMGNNTGQFNEPAFVTFVNDDEILVVDELNHRIQRFNVNTGTFVKSFGKQGTRDGEFKHPVSLCMDGEGHFVVADYHNNRVQVLSQNGERVFKFGESGPGKLDCPLACIYYRNNFIVSDGHNDCLKVFDSSGKFLYKIGEQGSGDGQLQWPWGLCVEQCGNHQNLLVCNCNNGRVDQFTMEGIFTGKTGEKLQNPRAITTTPDGQILVCGCSSNKIYVLK